VTGFDLSYRIKMEPDISSLAALISEPARGRILITLLDGRALPARVAELLESMARFAPRKQTDSSKPKSPIQIARTCYNHLAGSLGVRITEAIVGQGLLREVGRDYQLTKKGAQWFSELGIDTGTLRKSGRVFARQCLDWSERRNHLAGALGSALSDHLFERGWIEHVRESRAVRITGRGRRELKRRLGVACDK
jgi:hypothetical protein